MMNWQTIIGVDLVARFGDRLFCHDAEDAGNIVNLGVTQHGYDVELSRFAVEADLCIYINAAALGFSGGWKSIAVGLSTWQSIRRPITRMGCRCRFATTACTLSSMR